MVLRLLKNSSLPSGCVAHGEIHRQTSAILEDQRHLHAGAGLPVLRPPNDLLSAAFAGRDPEYQKIGEAQMGLVLVDPVRDNLPVCASFPR